MEQKDRFFFQISDKILKERGPNVKINTTED